MSRSYRMMQEAEIRAAHRPRNRLSYARKTRLLREVDRTGDSPLMAAPGGFTRWHVAMAEPRREQAAMQALSDAGWIVWYPQETIWRETAARRERTRLNVPLFARYLFVVGQGGKPIGDCRHVSALLPYLVRGRLIAELAIRQNGGEFKTADLPVFDPGQQVVAEFGAFAALNGIVKQANHERVRILTSLFGSEREIEVTPDRVKAA